jgi:hypothetical protein
VTGPEANPPGFDPQLLPGPPGTAAPEDPESIAAEQLAHGLLGHLHRDLPLVQERRIASVMSAIAGEAEAAAPPPTFRLRTWLPLSGAAAAVFIIAFFLAGPPSGQTALAVVQDSIAAAQSAGDRSYRVRVIPHDDAPVGEQPSARIDLRNADHLVINAISPHGHRVAVGRTPDGAWAIRPDGSIDRYPPRHAWPRWINFGQSTFLIESVDSMLETLPEAYELQLLDPAPLPDTHAPVFERVTAIHEPRPSPEPRQIELWIDVDSRLVHRMELHWPDSPGRTLEDGPPPHHDMSRGGPPPRHDGPPGRRPPHPDGRRPGGPPAFIDGPPDFAGGRHPPPPRTVLFEMIETEAFPDGWFTPETHQQP